MTLIHISPMFIFLPKGIRKMKHWPERVPRCHCRCSGVFIFNFEHISYLVLMFLLLNLSRYLTGALKIYLLFWLFNNLPTGSSDWGITSILCNSKGTTKHGIIIKMSTKEYGSNVQNRLPRYMLCSNFILETFTIFTEINCHGNTHSLLVKIIL